MENTFLPQRHLVDHDYFESYSTISKYVEDTSIYIAGFVVKKNLNKIVCESCKASLICKQNKSTNSLISIKDRGGLVHPSKAVELVCQEAERIFRGEDPLFFNNTKKKTTITE